jgi:hypothetical protein
MDPRFGHDFGHVRVHADARAAESARLIGARAYTAGADVVFASGQFETGTITGRTLLAHELAHVLQQRESVPGVQAHLAVSPPGDRFEQEADRVAHAVMQPEMGSRQQIEGIRPARVLDEDEAAVAHGIGALTPLRAAVVQRTATFVAGSVRAERNMAAQIADGRPAGETWMTLNGTPLVTEADAFAAIKPPALSGRSTRTTSECWVERVADNVGSVDESVPTSGPWRVVTTPQNLWDRIGVAVAQCFIAKPGTATLTAIGKPSDADVAAGVRTHEDRHAADDEKVFQSTIGAWDLQLTIAQAFKSRFSGKDAFECEESLYQALGGTPDAVALRYRNDGLAAGVAFHGTPAGRNVGVANATADPDCTAATIEVS